MLLQLALQEVGIVLIELCRIEIGYVGGDVGGTGSFNRTL